MIEKGHAIVLFDDYCGICTKMGRFIRKRDRRGYFTIIGLKSERADEILTTIPARLEKMDSVFLVDAAGQWYSRSTAVIRILARLRWPWPLLSVSWLIPSLLRDTAYKIFARHRRHFSRPK